MERERKGHVITPEGKEIVSTNAMFKGMPRDWRALASFIPCPDCTGEVGKPADHAAGAPRG